MSLTTCGLLFLWLAGADPAAAPAAWPGFLGQGATEIRAESLPLTWTDTTNVAWKVKLPGKGQSSPVIRGDLVVVTSIEGTMKDQCHVTAFRLSDGAKVWDHAMESSQPVRGNYFQSRSAPTPLIDAAGVYAFFETGKLVGLSHEGQRLWERSLTEEYGPFESTIGLASSPLQTADRVILLVDHEGPSYLLAVDKRTGETVWKTDRDSRVSYASPALLNVGDETHVVCSSAGSVDGYSPVTGELLWSFTENIGGNRSATPLAIGPGRFVIGASPGMHNENESEARQSNGVMTVTKTESGYEPRVAWRTNEALPAFNSPMVHRGLAYWVNRVGVVFCFDAETGEKKFAKRIAQGCWATPTGIDDRIYIFGKDGVTTVLAAGPEYQVLAENTLWDPLTAGDESQARNRAAGREPGETRRGGTEGHGHGDAPAKGAGDAGSTDDKKPTGAKEGNASAGKPLPEAAKAKPAPANEEGGARRSGRPRSPEDEAKARAQGEGRFADPIQYGVAIVEGSIVVRTGDTVYCLRTSSPK